MSRSQLRHQRGFGLLVFVAMVSLISFSIVLGYSGQLAKYESNRRPVKQKAYLNQVRDQLQAFYLANATLLDEPSAGNNYTVEALVQAAGIHRRWDVRFAMSRVLDGDTGLKHRRVVAFFPTDTDVDNPPDLESFEATGHFVSCVNAGMPCAKRELVDFDSLWFHKDARIETQRRLERAALKAQAYFRARMLQDPEKNISVNWFRPPFADASGTCPSTPAYLQDLPCLNTYTPLAYFDTGSATWKASNSVAQQLGLADDELVSAWGDPLELTNLQDSETTDPPFTMVFRFRNPFGGYITVRAVQQI